MNKDTLYVKRKRPTDMLLLAAIYISATLAVALLLGIILYVFVKGIHTVNWAFLTTVTSARKQTTGIAGNLLNTLYIIVITLLIATPIGVGSAIYLNEYAKPGKLVSLIEFTTETLSGIPSIIFGLFGMIFFGETLGFGYSRCSPVSFYLSTDGAALITRNTQGSHRELGIFNDCDQCQKTDHGYCRQPVKYSVHHRDHSADRNPHWCGKRYLPERICQTRQVGLPH